MTDIQVLQVGDWTEAKRILRKHGQGGSRTLTTAISRAVRTEAEHFRRAVVQGIRSQAPGGKRFVPLRPITVGNKRSNKALIDTGALFRAIKVKRIRGGEYFVGVLRTARSKTGTGLANLGAVHEYGATIAIKVTPKMVRAFYAKLRRAGDTMAKAAGSARRAKTERGRQRAQARLPVGGSKRGKVSGGAFKPGSTIVIRIPPRPFLQPVYDQFKDQSPQRVQAAVARALDWEFGRV